MSRHAMPGGTLRFKVCAGSFHSVIAHQARSSEDCPKPLMPQHLGPAVRCAHWEHGSGLGEFDPGLSADRSRVEASLTPDRACIDHRSTLDPPQLDIDLRGWGGGTPDGPWNRGRQIVVVRNSGGTRPHSGRPHQLWDSARSGPSVPGLKFILRDSGQIVFSEAGFGSECAQAPGAFGSRPKRGSHLHRAARCTTKPSKAPRALRADVKHVGAPAVVAARHRLRHRERQWE